MLQIGDKPSSFQENPVDIVDKDKIMEELADKIATEKYNQKITELERGITANQEGVSIVSKNTRLLWVKLLTLTSKKQALSLKFWMKEFY